MTQFKYFDKPELFTGLLDDETTCACCGKTKKCFDASAFYGEDSIDAICPECLAGGALYERDIFTCQGNFEDLAWQLKGLNPGMSPEAIDELARKKTEELEKTTPLLVNWQDWVWPCVEGDYCRFIGYGSRPFYNKLARDKDGEALFKDSFYYTQEGDLDVDELWEDLPRKEIKDYEASSELAVLFYVFQSLHSERIFTIWDAV